MARCADLSRRCSWSEPRQLFAALPRRLAFPSQPAEAVEAGGAQASRLGRAPHRAPRLAVVSAVPEPAPRGQRPDVVERVVERVRILPQLQLAHARRVDEQAPVGQENQLALRRRVPAAAVAAPHLRGPLSFVAQQVVDDGRLADAGRADEGAGPSRREMLPQGLDPAGAQGLDDVQGGLGGQGRGGGAAVVAVGAEVGLVEHEHRRGAAVPNGHEIALDAPEVEVAVEAAHQEHGVDVGGDELPAGRLAGRLAREAVAPGQHRLDGRAVAVRAGANGDPVADDRTGVGSGGPVAHPARDLGHHLAVGGAELIKGVVGDGDAGRPQAAVCARLESGLEPVVPPQGLERQHIDAFPAAGQRFRPSRIRAGRAGPASRFGGVLLPACRRARLQPGRGSEPADARAARVRVSWARPPR